MIFSTPRLISPRFFTLFNASHRHSSNYTGDVIDLNSEYIGRPLALGTFGQNDGDRKTKYAPNFGQGIWKYHAAELIGIESHWLK